MTAVVHVDGLGDVRALRQRVVHVAADPKAIPEIEPEAMVEQAFDNLGDKQNVVVKFVGYTDASPLTGRTQRIYGDHSGLSKARARRVALAVQDALELPTAAILSDGEGSVRPLGSNQTVQGRALNRRVEIWVR